MNRFSIPKQIFASIFLFSAIFLGCLKAPPDAPPDLTHQDPPLKANWTISALKEHPLGTVVLEDKIIAAVVVMDDQSGNYYKRIVLQDSTGGIEILLDRNFLFIDYPVGRRIFIKCKGLFLGERNGMIQIGDQPDANGMVTALPEPKFGSHLIPGAFPVSVSPDTLELFQLTATPQALRYLNTLVAIKNIQFADSNINRSYAAPSDRSSATGLRLEDCFGTSITLRTSAYANFQALQTPRGNGIFVGIYTRFNEQPQLTIRDTTDIRFYHPRCTDISAETEELTIQQLRGLYHGTPFPIGNYKIRGIIISDQQSKNTPQDIFVLQGIGQGAGIHLELSGNQIIPLGTELSLNLENALLVDNYGSLFLKNISPINLQIIGTGKNAYPVLTNIAQIKASPQSFDGRLVKLEHITWLDFPAYFSGISGNLRFTDGTDTLQHFCESSATFSQQFLPGKNFNSLTGYIFIRNKKVFLKMRNPVIDLHP